ncbi:uncharacterized protein K444DRAFT_663307 [Hyaloscypha bicolor E]|uniref:Uncharacterized protein n=1 Tax=Hyaloscypha bicolor E TaxID=1095630 RepID=A0A2J6TC00_9HELO|nr:uncharacterized protein K444DRAFT_663307 [Hyaloscypha bicolor E]PMD60560.1 hypothetical protein K444DRAFT_663307 [Hyaloscypha bicolor E]
MGNPNARPKRGSIRRTDSQQSNHTYDSAVSPKTPSKRGALDSGSSQTDNSMGDIGSVSLEKGLMESGVANLSIQDESSTKPSLKFKSYKTGTLITNNGVPADAFIEAFPPPKPSPKPSQLSATTPAFVPRTPQPPTMAAKGILPSLNTVTPAFQRVQNLLNDLRSPANAGPSHQVPAYNPFYTPPTSGPSPLPATPDYQLLAPTRPPRVYYQRAEKSKKDIIVTASGVTRNAVKVVERFLPNGSPYHDYTSEFDGPEYNFVEEFKKMSVKEKTDLLAHKQVEILVKLESYDREEKVEIVAVKKKGKGKKKVHAKEGESSQGVDNKDKGNEEEDTTQVAEEGGAKATTVIDTLNTLGPDFASNTKSLFVTLDFTSIPSSYSSSSTSSEPTAIPTGPRGTPTPLLTGPLSFGLVFASITSLVRALQAFTALKHMVINLRVLSAHNSRPISIPQLTLVLPFYDLGFTDWKVSYCTEFLTSSIPVREWDYPLKWLDRERNKILRERERKLEGAVFVRRSSVEGNVARWKNQK